MSKQVRFWDEYHMLKASGGRWLRKPLPKWRAIGVKTYAPSVTEGDFVIVREPSENWGVSHTVINRIPTPSGFMVTEKTANIVLKEVRGNQPILQVENTENALLALGKYARDQMNGAIIGVTGSSGKTTFTAMLSHILNLSGTVYHSTHNGNTPRGVAWNLASADWDATYQVIEMSLRNMNYSTNMARPNIAVFLNVHPAHIGKTHTVIDIAKAKSRIFSGVTESGVAVINRDMFGYDIARAAAVASDLKIIEFGTHKDCDVRMKRYVESTGEVVASVGDRDLTYHIAAEGHHMAILSVAVIGVLQALDLPIDEPMKCFQTFEELPGRGKKIKIIFKNKAITLIDDAYNANPGSMKAALERLACVEHNGRRIAILGQMEELGRSAPQYHSELLQYIDGERIDKVYVIGEHYKPFWDKLKDHQKGAYLEAVDDIKTVIMKDVRDGDVLLIKGSNSTNLHTITKWLASENNI